MKQSKQEKRRNSRAFRAAMSRELKEHKASFLVFYLLRALVLVSLDATRSNRVVTVPNIQDVTVNGESLGVGGYLDIGIIDTMKDLFVNFIGAVVFSAAGFFYAGSKGRKRTPAQNFVPSRKQAEQDYLVQAREELLAEEQEKEPILNE